jgi:hypothetical protein
MHNAQHHTNLKTQMEDLVPWRRGPPQHDPHPVTTFCRICSHFYTTAAADVASGAEAASASAAAAGAVFRGEKTSLLPGEWSQAPYYNFPYEIPYLAWHVHTDPLIMENLSAADQVLVHNVLSFVIRCKNFLSDCEAHIRHGTIPQSLFHILDYNYNAQDQQHDLTCLIGDAIEIIDFFRAHASTYAGQFILSVDPNLGANPPLMISLGQAGGIERLSALLERCNANKYNSPQMEATARQVRQTHHLHSTEPYERSYDRPLVSYDAHSAERAVEAIAFSEKNNRRDHRLLSNLLTFVERSKIYLLDASKNGNTLSPSDREFLLSLQSFVPYTDANGIPRLVEHALALLDRCNRPYDPRNDETTGFKTNDVREFILYDANSTLLREFSSTRVFRQRMQELLEVHDKAVGYFIHH